MENLLELILSNCNLNEAIARVVKNKGAAGIDGMNVEQGRLHFMKHGDEIKRAIRNRKYKPNPVRRVEIPKPDGGVRLLGIPTVIDRIIQQAINQVLSPIFEKQFSDSSFGFRPNRGCHMAIERSLMYLNDGYKVIVDTDLEKFFDKVNHDKLMQILSLTIKDSDLMSLIRKYLVSGIMINGVVIDSEEGTPQGGPLSPLLSNIMLNELDKELTKRGLRFVRYADDCNIYVKSIRAGQRVMESITNFIEKKLKLKVNQSKSKVDYYNKGIKFLGFGFYYNPRHRQVRIKVHPKSIKRIKEKIKKLTSRRWSISLDYRLLKIKQLITGWVNYYKVADMKWLLIKLDEQIRFRVRMCIWKAWKKIGKRFKSLRKLGASRQKAWEYANSRKSYARIAHSFILTTTITNKRLERRGLISMTEYYLSVR
ncbi:group II intron reverse transcriptase/maturase [Mycoplasmatota bacterium]|nr:group II intron reverse transcriptase/maturase [Mycoplasmatota bacterium]